MCKKNNLSNSVYTNKWDNYHSNSKVKSVLERRDISVSPNNATKSIQDKVVIKYRTLHDIYWAVIDDRFKKDIKEDKDSPLWLMIAESVAPVILSRYILKSISDIIRKKISRGNIYRKKKQLSELEFISDQVLKNTGSSSIKNIKGSIDKTDSVKEDFFESTKYALIDLFDDLETQALDFSDKQSMKYYKILYSMTKPSGEYYDSIKKETYLFLVCSWSDLLLSYDGGLNIYVTFILENPKVRMEVNKVIWKGMSNGVIKYLNGNAYYQNKKFYEVDVERYKIIVTTKGFSYSLRDEEIIVKRSGKGFNTYFMDGPYTENLTGTLQYFLFEYGGVVPVSNDVNYMNSTLSAIAGRVLIEKIGNEIKN